MEVLTLIASYQQTKPGFIKSGYKTYKPFLKIDKKKTIIDGIINILDVVQVVNLILSNEYNSSADLNSDTTVDILDIVQLVNIILN